MILGDFNTKIGRERAYQTVTSEHTLHVTTNGNGQLDYEYSSVNDKVVAITFFQHKNT